MARTSPALFDLVSLIALLGQALCFDGQLLLPQGAWYHKRKPTLVIAWH